MCLLRYRELLCLVLPVSYQLVQWPRRGFLGSAAQYVVDKHCMQGWLLKETHTHTLLAHQCLDSHTGTLLHSSNYLSEPFFFHNFLIQTYFPLCQVAACVTKLLKWCCRGERGQEDGHAVHVARKHSTGERIRCNIRTKHCVSLGFRLDGSAWYLYWLQPQNREMFRGQSTCHKHFCSIVCMYITLHV